MNIKLETVERSIYFAAGGKESLIINIRGRGWFISTGGNPKPGLTRRRRKAWITDDGDSFTRINKINFNFGRP